MGFPMVFLWFSYGFPHMMIILLVSSGCGAILQNRFFFFYADRLCYREAMRTCNRGLCAEPGDISGYKL